MSPAVKLEQHREEIIALLKSGSRKRYVAQKFKTTDANLYYWLKRHKLQDIEEEY